MANPFGRSAITSGSGAAPSVASAPAGTGGGVNFTAARSELGDAMAGRISLAILNSMILALVLFYIWTRKAQGGG